MRYGRFFVTNNAVRRSNSFSDEAREELRRKVVAAYGEGLELIGPA
jgi:hypothetical protein